MALDPDEHRLTEAQHEAVFQRIKDEIFAHAKTVERPVAIIFGGQPGAGKSAAVSKAVQELQARGGAAEIIGDDFRGFHPKFDRLMAEDDKTAAFYTDRDTGRWVEKAIAYAKDQRLNVVIEGTMRDASKVAETLTSLKTTGYEIDARALAVNPRLSWQGVMERYEQQKADRGNGRMTAPHSHQAALDGMPVTLEKIEREKLADKVTLMRRGLEVVYSNRLEDGQWLNPPAAAQALQVERERPMTLGEAQAYQEGFARVEDMMKRPGRQADQAELRILAELQAEAEHGLAAAVFRERSPVDGVKTHPELAGSYAVYAAIESKVKTEIATPEAKAIILDRARANISVGIERGEYVSINRVVGQENNAKPDIER